MELVPLALPPGIFSDDTSFASGARWADGDNVRFRNGRPETIGGRGLALTLDVGTYGIVRKFFPFTRSGALVVAYGTITISGAAPGPRLLVGATTPGAGIAGVLSTPSDETPTGLSNDTLTWSIDSWGDMVLAVPRGDTLYEQSGSGTATEVTNAPDNINAMLISAERQVLAFGCNEEGSGTFNPMCIRGSDIEDYTDWTTSSINNAFEHILEGHGVIQTALQVGAYIAVWTESSLYIGQFLGDPAQTYRFDMIDENCGLAGPDAVTVLNGRAYWMGPDLMPRTWAPGELPQIIPWPARQDFLDNFNIDGHLVQRITACAVARFQEIWFHYQDSRDSVLQGQNNRFVAYCVTESAAAGHPVWFRGQSGRTGMIDNGLFATVTYGLLDAPTIIASVSGAILIHEMSTNAIDGDGVGGVTPYITTGDFSFENGGRRVMVRGIMHDLKNQVGSAYLTLTVRQSPQSPTTTKGPFTLSVGAAKKYFRASGNLITAKFAGTGGTNTAWRFGTPLFDVVGLGER